MNIVSAHSAITQRTKSVRELVATAREKFQIDLEMNPSGFDAVSWDFSSLKDRRISSTNRRVYFTRHGSTDQPLPALYAEVVKRDL